MNKIKSEPYRLFFSLGWFLGLWGVALWMMFLGGVVPYPASWHAYVMIGGFLTSFTAGFIMTAVPRFTGTFTADRYEIALPLLGLVMLPLAIVVSESLGSVCVLIVHLSLVLFFARRFRRRRGSLPLAFLFLPLSLLISALGHTLILFAHSELIDSSFYSLGRLLAFYAYMLGVVLGVGSKLVPIFLGLGPAKEPDPLFFVVNLIAFFGSYLLQSLGWVRWSFGVRFMSLGYVAFGLWSLHQRPKNPSKLSYGLWVSCWGLLLGTFGGLLFPSYLMSWNHVLFIAGFGLMTFMVSSRVILSHGGYDLAFEGNRRNLLVVGGLLVLAGLVRSFVGWIAGTSLLLFASSFLWLIALLLWWHFIGQKSFSYPDEKIGSKC